MHKFQYFPINCVRKVFCLLVRQYRHIMMVAIFLFFLSTLLKWGIVCFNIQSWWRIQELCTNYQNGKSVGKLCPRICENQYASFTCETFHAGKETVLSTNWNGTNIILKQPMIDERTSNLLNWIDTSNEKLFITHKEFLNMIQSNVRLKFNLNIDISMAEEIVKQFNNRLDLNFSEINSLWTLLQNNEYLALILYKRFDVFPELIGSCGFYFATPKLTSLNFNLILWFYQKDEWKRRVKLALKILDFVKKIDQLSDPLHICDVKLNHFVLTRKLDKIKYVDLDAVHPKSIVNDLVNNGRSCIEDSECDYFDCRSVCDVNAKRCINNVLNNNLQIICEKIFLGWVVTENILISGLLVSPYMPNQLLDVLHLCANPNGELNLPRSSTSVKVGEKLYGVLKSIIT